MDLAEIGRGREIFFFYQNPTVCPPSCESPLKFPSATLLNDLKFGMQLAAAHITLAAAFLLLHGKIGNGAEK
jgi:hypothetical protein